MHDGETTCCASIGLDRSLGTPRNLRARLHHITKCDRAMIATRRTASHVQVATRVLGCSRAEQCHIVPSPLVGEGQGEGYIQARHLFVAQDQAACAFASPILCARLPRAQSLLPPLSLSLLHTWGGFR